MIETRKIRQLDLSEPLQAGRPSFLTAASGLVHYGRCLYVVADDEHHLGVFSDQGDKPGEVIQVFDGELPVEKKSRKKVKPDWESLVRVTHPIHAPHGALLLVPSGSKSHRTRGAIIRFDEGGRIGSYPQELDFSSFMNCLPFEVPNIEAAAVSGSRLCILNRGNTKDDSNALLIFDLKQTLNSLFEAKSHKCESCTYVDLGKHNGVPITFTDASAVGDMLVFTAAAEDTEDSYEDGPSAGAAVGILSLDGKISYMDMLSPASKVEGISARREGERLHCLLVNDEDDPSIASSLLECFI